MESFAPKMSLIRLSRPPVWDFLLIHRKDLWRRVRLVEFYQNLLRKVQILFRIRVPPSRISRDCYLGFRNLEFWIYVGYRTWYTHRFHGLELDFLGISLTKFTEINASSLSKIMTWINHRILRSQIDCIDDKQARSLQQMVSSVRDLYRDYEHTLNNRI